MIPRGGGRTGGGHYMGGPGRAGMTERGGHSSRLRGGVRGALYSGSDAQMAGQTGVRTAEQIYAMIESIPQPARHAE